MQGTHKTPRAAAAFAAAFTVAALAALGTSLALTPMARAEFVALGQAPLYIQSEETSINITIAGDTYRTTRLHFRTRPEFIPKSVTTAAEAQTLAAHVLTYVPAADDVVNINVQADGRAPEVARSPHEYMATIPTKHALILTVVGKTSPNENSPREQFAAHKYWLRPELVLDSRNIVVTYTVRIRAGSVLNKELTYPEVMLQPGGRIETLDFVYDIQSALPLQLQTYELAVLNGKPKRYSIVESDPHHIRIESRHLGASFVRVNERSPGSDTSAVGGDTFGFHITTAPSWQALYGPTAETYNLLANAPLPPEFEAGLEKAARAPNTEAKLRAVMAFVGKTVPYDLAAAHPSRSWPHDLETIAKRGGGVCKEQALVTIALLRRLGFSAHPALTRTEARADGYEAMTLPTTLNFNHIAVVARAGSATYWLDPTNEPKNARTLPVTLAGKQVIELNPTSIKVIRLPFELPNRLTQAYVIELKNDRTGEVDTSAPKGPRAEVSKIARAEAFDFDVQNHDIGQVATAATRILDYEYPSQSMLYFATKADTKGPESGKAGESGGNADLSRISERKFVILAPTYIPWGIEPKTRTASFFMGIPRTIETTVVVPEKIKDIVKGAEITRSLRELPDNCEVRSRWFHYKRVVRRFGGGLGRTARVHQTTRIFQVGIPLEDLRSPEFEAVQRELERCRDRAEVGY